MWWPSSDYHFFLGFLLFFMAILLGIFLFAKDKDEDKPFRQTFFEASQTSLSDLQWAIKRLLQSGIHDARLDISFPDLDLRVMFRKYISKTRDYGIAFHIPDRGGSDSCFTAFRGYCQENQVPFTVEPNLDETQADWLRVDCGRDCEKAYHFLEVLAEEIAGIPDKADHEYDLTGVLPGDELVDDPDQKPLSNLELSIARQKEFRKRAGASIIELNLFFWLSLAGALGYFGLVYALLMGIIARVFAFQNTWSTFSLELFGIAFTPRNFDVVCLALILITAVNVLTRVYWLRLMGQSDLALRRSTALFWYPGRRVLWKALEAKVKNRWNIVIPLAMLSWIQF